VKETDMTTSTNPIHNIKDHEEHIQRWDAFVHEAGAMGRAAYDEFGGTPAQLGRALHELRRGNPSEHSPLALAAFAYELNLRSMNLKDKVYTAVALHMPRRGIFDFFMASEFGIGSSHIGFAAYSALKAHFDAWLATFGDSPLEHRYNNKESGA
jgi:hypothetical protein